MLGDTGDLKIATFNMLNYFNTFGETWAASDGNAAGSDGTSYDFTNPRRCSFYRDRGSRCRRHGHRGPPHQRHLRAGRRRPAHRPQRQAPGPRGAANEANFLRQEAKELEAINTIDADVMSLEEVENSIKLYDAAIDGPDGADNDRDDALKRLVQQLNAHWAADHPADTDRVGLRAVSAPRGAADGDRAGRHPFGVHLQPEQGRAGRPVAGAGQLGRRSATPASRWPRRSSRSAAAGRDAFGVIVNHFKSKGGPHGAGHGQR